MILSNEFSDYKSIHDFVEPNDIIVFNGNHAYKKYLNNLFITPDQLNAYKDRRLVVLVDMSNHNVGDERNYITIENPEEFEDVLYVLVHSREVFNQDRVSMISDVTFNCGYHLKNHVLLACVPFGQSCEVDDRINAVKSNFFYDLHSQYRLNTKTHGIDHKDFLLYLGKPKPERLFLLSQLHQRGLLSRGHVSAFLDVEYNHLDVNLKNSEFFTHMLGESNVVIEAHDHLRTMADQFPFIITEPKLTWNIGNTEHIVKEHYEKTDFEIVLETCPTISNQNGFLTEKIFKPIRMNQPFYVLSHPHTCELIKNLIPPCKHHLLLDMSEYDHIQNMTQRIEKIVDLAEKRLN